MTNPIVFLGMTVISEGGYSEIIVDNSSDFSTQSLAIYHQLIESNTDELFIHISISEDENEMVENIFNTFCIKKIDEGWFTLMMSIFSEPQFIVRESLLDVFEAINTSMDASFNSM